jgi:protein-arginine kinase activator protein McsA
MNDNFIVDLVSMLIVKKDINFVQSLLSYPLNAWINEYFDYLRENEKAFEFAKICNYILDYNENQLDQKEYIRMKNFLKGFYISTLDNSNQWKHYISYYESLDQNDIFKSACHARYLIIKRKQYNLEHGKNIEHLKKHPKSKLRNEEVEQRIRYIERKLELALKRCDGGGS